ncbi:hypothetical protein TNCV_129311 [Trichonephila clavipes]|nr:hypothetical protein TNCV_129311 [Trichonephila clavipes]
MSVLFQINLKRLYSLLHQTTPTRWSPRRSSISFTPTQFSALRSQKQQGTVSLSNRTFRALLLFMLVWVSPECAMAPELFNWSWRALLLFMLVWVSPECAMAPELFNWSWRALLLFMLVWVSPECAMAPELLNWSWRAFLLFMLVWVSPGGF